jgi:hypothetical protein
MTDPINLDAAESRAIEAWRWINAGAEDGFVPLSVRVHFNNDFIDMAAEVASLRAQVAEKDRELAEAQPEATKFAAEGKWVEHYAIDTPEGRRWYSRDRLPASSQIVAWRQAWEGPAQVGPSGGGES